MALTPGVGKKASAVSLLAICLYKNIQPDSRFPALNFSGWLDWGGSHRKDPTPFFSNQPNEFVYDDSLLPAYILAS